MTNVEALTDHINAFYKAGGTFKTLILAKQYSELPDDSTAEQLVRWAFDNLGLAGDFDYSEAREALLRAFRRRAEMAAQEAAEQKARAESCRFEANLAQVLWIDEI
jgi:hypothetical protein